MTSDILEQLRTAYSQVEEWPEKRGNQGFMDLISLRNLVPDAIAEIERLRDILDRYTRMYFDAKYGDKNTVNYEFNTMMALDDIIAAVKTLDPLDSSMTIRLAPTATRS